MASEQLPSRQDGFLKRALRFGLFGLIPLLLVASIVIVGVQLAQALARYTQEQALVSERLPLYIQTATAIAPTVNAEANAEANAESNAEPDATEAVALKFEPRLNAARPVYQEFVTNTPAPDMSGIVLPPVNTPVPQITATAAPTEAPAQSATPQPLPTLLMPANVEPRVAAPTAIPSQVPAVDRRQQDILNILLLGNDGELTDDNFIRTDTMIILSVNRTAGTVAMLSIPRDLYVYMPGWAMQRINVAYTYGESAGWTDGGFGLLRETLYYNFGINVHYYAMVDLSGFKEIVDTVGGIDIAVDCALQDLPLIGAEVPAAAYRANDDGEMILPVGYYHFTGAESLWYARSRTNSSDFDRGSRQQQVLRAIWRKARDSGELANLPQLWQQGMSLVQTNIPFEVAVSLLPIALNLEPTRMEQFAMRRLYDTTPWQTPDGDFVQLPIYEHILELLNDMYQPPTQSQIASEGASIAVYNGTANPDWDRVAAERLGWEGYNAIPSGPAPTTDYADTVLIDYTGATKGSSLNDLVNILNVNPANIRLEATANRTVDFEIIVGSSFTSCSRNVLPVATATPGS